MAGNPAFINVEPTVTNVKNTATTVTANLKSVKSQSFVAPLKASSGSAYFRIFSPISSKSKFFMKSIVNTVEL